MIFFFIFLILKAQKQLINPGLGIAMHIDELITLQQHKPMPWAAEWMIIHYFKQHKFSASTD